MCVTVKLLSQVAAWKAERTQKYIVTVGIEGTESKIRLLCQTAAEGKMQKFTRQHEG